MSKRMLALLLLMLGLASVDAVLDHENYAQGTETEEAGQVQKMDIDGCPLPK